MVEDDSVGMYLKMNGSSALLVALGSTKTPLSARREVCAQMSDFTLWYRVLNVH